MQTEIITPITLPTRKPLISGLAVAGGLLAILILTGLLIWGIFWAAANHPDIIEALRDIVIIGLALASCLFGITLILIVVMLIRLVNVIEFEIKPILQQTNETISTVRGTTNFVSKNVVKPVAKASSYVAGLRRGLQVLFGDPDKNLPS